MVDWPSSLPQSPLLAGFEDVIPTLSQDSPTDSGIPISRRRFTAGIRQQVWPLLLTDAQYATLETFFTATLAGGSLKFEHTNVVTSATETWRIVSMGKPKKISGTLWQVILQMIQYP